MVQGVVFLLLPQITIMKQYCGLSSIGNPNDIEWPSKSLTYCKPFQMPILSELIYQLINYH